MSRRREVSAQDARRIGDTLEADWGEVNLEAFRAGVAIELKPGARDPANGEGGP